MTWQTHAACRGMDPDLFYPSENDDRNKRNHARILYAEARVVCMACPVRAACLEQALADGETSYGMYGGMSPSERRAHLRQRGGVDDAEHNRRRRVNRAANKTTTPAALALAEAMR